MPYVELARAESPRGEVVLREREDEDGTGIRVHAGNHHRWHCVGGQQAHPCCRRAVPTCTDGDYTSVQLQSADLQSADLDAVAKRVGSALEAAHGAATD